MRTLRAVVAYDGTRYSGWQAQEGHRTIQGEIEAAILKMTEEPVRLRAASRTDAGVHARGQVFAFDTSKDRIPLHGFLRGLNSMLPRQITLGRVEEVEAGHHPRHHARGKIYRYSLWQDQAPSALDRDRAWWVRERLDLALMQAAAPGFVGTHDFEAFRSAGCPAKHAVRTMYRVEVTRGPYSLWWIDVLGNAFCRNMVRIMVGTLVDIGRGRLDATAVTTALAGRKRTLAGITAPSEGLCLEEVIFDDRLPPKPRSTPSSEHAMLPVEEDDELA